MINGVRLILNKFKQEVIEALKVYVYRLVDPRNGETFYIGKGVGNRVFQHVEDATSNNSYASLNSDEDEDIESEEYYSQKINRIKEILNADMEVIHIIHKHGMDHETAFAVEAALIDAYPALSNAVGGHGSSDFGPMNVSELEKLYGRSEFEDIGHKLILININETVKSRLIYDAVRCAWRMGMDRAKKSDFILAHSRGIIRGVFKPLEWKVALKENFKECLKEDFPDRIGFIGEDPTESIKNHYIGKLIPASYRKKGASNPIRFNY
jgi:hypothetical protein